MVVMFQSLEFWAVLGGRFLFHMFVVAASIVRRVFEFGQVPQSDTQHALEWMLTRRDNLIDVVEIQLWFSVDNDEYHISTIKIIK